MAYFNHAFNKMFVGTGTTLDPLTPSDTNPATEGGFIITGGVSSAFISGMGPGYYGFVNPNSWTTVTSADFSGNAQCCPLVLVSSSVLERDKIGKYHGGYLETNKSKIINPKYIQRYYRVDPCLPQQCVVGIGNSPSTAGTGADPQPEQFQGGTTEAGCCKEFLCGETYYLRIDVKGSPALRALNHQAYYTVDAYGGCCGENGPEPIDSTLIMIQWAERILITEYLKSFVFPVVYDETGVAWYPPNTTVTQDGTNTPVTSAQWWTAYVSPGHTTGLCAGLRLFGAYIDTRFLDCSFQVTDFFEKEPVRIFASEVDYNGDPCAFTGLCVYNECYGTQGMGFGEQVVRDLIRSESYLQNFFHTDIRIREITQGNQLLNVIDRTSFYTRYYLLHSVPRYNNPTGTFDNDRYLLEIVIETPAPFAAGGNTELEQFMDAWLGDCPGCIDLATESCTECVILADDSIPSPL